MIGRVVSFLLAKGWAALNCAVVLLPFKDLVTHGNRGMHSKEFAEFGTLTAGHLLSIVTPSAIRFDFDWERTLFIGGGVCIAGCAALLKPRRAPLIVLLLVGGIIGLGQFGPFHGQLAHLLPGYEALRLHGRAGILLIISLTVAFSLWASDTTEEVLSWRLLTVSGSFLLASLGAALSGKAWPMSLRDVLWLSLCAGTIVAATATARSKDFIGKGIALIALFASVLEVQDMKQRYNIYRATPLKPGFEHSLDRLKASMQDALLREGWDGPPRVLVPGAVFPINGAMALGVSHCDAYTSLFLARPWKYLHSAADVAPSDVINSYLHRSVATCDPENLLAIGINCVWDSDRKDYRWLNSTPFRAFVVHQTVEAKTPEAALKETLERRAELDQIAVVECSSALTGGSTSASSPCAITRFNANRLTVHVSTKKAGFLVLREAWFPGWVARIDGLSGPAVPVNYWMRGFRVPPGDYLAEIEFRPSSLIWGAVGSILGVTAVIWQWYKLKGPRKFNVA